MTVMQVLAVAPEVFPLVKTGGLADVAGALPLALAAEDVETVTLVPGWISAWMCHVRRGSAPAIKQGCPVMSGDQTSPSGRIR